jgi:hypothetical protein
MTADDIIVRRPNVTGFDHRSEPRQESPSEPEQTPPSTPESVPWWDSGEGNWIDVHLFNLIHGFDPETSNIQTHEDAYFYLWLQQEVVNSSNALFHSEPWVQASVWESVRDNIYIDVTACWHVCGSFTYQEALSLGVSALGGMVDLPRSEVLMLRQLMIKDRTKACSAAATT